MIKRLFYKIIRKSPATMPMVSYWKFKTAVPAKVMKSKDGSMIMQLEGEKYPIATYPRSHVLFGELSKLKHQIKNRIFNDSWWKLEDGVSKELVIADIKRSLFGEIAELAEKSKYDMLPPESMCPSVREIHRAWTKVSPETGALRDYLCFVLQEDDSYRFRVQWIVNYFNPSRWWFHAKTIKAFDFALSMLEHGEVINDMKERMRLLRRILLLMLEDKKVRKLFEALCQEINWNKVKLTEGDKYHFRGKYFKTDYDLFSY